MKNDDLKACPFCGNKPYFTESTVSCDYDGFQDCIITIKCNCGVSMHKRCTVYPSGEKLGMNAIDMWNRRISE